MRVGDEDLWMALLGLLRQSWGAVGFKYELMTPQEHAVITKEQHARLVMLIETSRPIGDKRAEHELAQRAVMYAQRGVEAVELEREATVPEMKAIAGAIASGFIVGYGARCDDLALPLRKERALVGHSPKRSR